MGIFPALSVAIFDSSLSTQMTSFPFSARQAPTTSPTYPVPTTAIFIEGPRAGSSPMPDTHAPWYPSAVSSRDGGRISQQHADPERLRTGELDRSRGVLDRMVTCLRARPDRLSVRAARPQRRWRVRSSGGCGAPGGVSFERFAAPAGPDDLLELVERSPDSFERARRRQGRGPSRAGVGAQPGLASSRLAAGRAAGRCRFRRDAFAPSAVAPLARRGA